jgi:hypothetical protein
VRPESRAGFFRVQKHENNLFAGEPPATTSPGWPSQFPLRSYLLDLGTGSTLKRCMNRPRVPGRRPESSREGPRPVSPKKRRDEDSAPSQVLLYPVSTGVPGATICRWE